MQRVGAVYSCTVENGFNDERRWYRFLYFGSYNVCILYINVYYTESWSIGVVVCCTYMCVCMYMFRHHFQCTMYMDICGCVLEAHPECVNQCVFVCVFVLECAYVYLW